MKPHIYLSLMLLTFLVACQTQSERQYYPADEISPVEATARSDPNLECEMYPERCAEIPEDIFAPKSTGGDNQSGCPDGCTTHITGCDIKGNISFDSGEKIYHVPGDEYYSETTINPDYGERWFCTEAEAEANGWRRTNAR